MSRLRLPIISIFALLLLTGLGYGQSPMTDYLTFNDHVDFTMFGKSNNIKANDGFDGFSCSNDNRSSSSQSFSLPPNSTVVKALLYWAGSGQGDFEIKFSGPGFSGTPIAAERTFNATVENAPGEIFFSASCDVTTILQEHGYGNYTVSELDANRNSPYCPGHLFSGWVVVVVYENPNLGIGNTVKIYDGLEGIKYSSIEFNLNNLNIISTDNAKLGFVSWEGEKSVSDDEWLKVNGNLLSNSLNPSNNMFNGTNSFSGSSNNYNMDMDYFDISNYINIGDQNIAVKTKSGDDMTIFNIFAITYINKAPDASIHIDTLLTQCENPEIKLKCSVYNNGNDTLPEGTRIGFYLNSFPGLFIDSYETTIKLIPGNTLNITKNITLPGDLSGNIKIIAVVDDTRVIFELNEDNNTSSWQFTIPVSSHTEENYTFCEGDTLILLERSYTTTTLDTFYLLSSQGCDSIIYVSIEQLRQSSQTIEIGLCNGDNYTFPDSTSTDTAGVFTFLLVNDAGCDSNLTIRIKLLSESNFFTLGDDITVSLGYSETIRPILNFEPDSIIWSPDTYLKDANDLSKKVTPFQSITYIVTITDTIGCPHRDTLHVAVFAQKNIYFPNAFSPNDDGINDIFKFYTDLDVKIVKQFLIFDRWGEPVFQQHQIHPNDANFGWNGKYREKRLNPGVFVFLAEVEFLNGETEFFKGDVTLLR